MNLFEDKGFDLLPKVPVSPIVNIIQTPVSIPVSTGLDPLTTPASTEISKSTRAGQGIVGFILMGLLIASVVWVVVNANKYVISARSVKGDEN